MWNSIILAKCDRLMTKRVSVTEVGFAVLFSDIMKPFFQELGYAQVTIEELIMSTRYGAIKGKTWLRYSEGNSSGLLPLDFENEIFAVLCLVAKSIAVKLNMYGTALGVLNIILSNCAIEQGLWTLDTSL